MRVKLNTESREKTTTVINKLRSKNQFEIKRQQHNPKETILQDNFVKKKNIRAIAEPQYSKKLHDLE